MKIAIVTLALGLGLATLAAHPAAAREALCLVCQVKEGATHLEPVRATRTHEGAEYGFCSESCAEEFMTDPLAYVPPVLPRPAPAFVLRDLAGNEVTLESLRGRVVLLDFWATWCAPCRKSMPELEALHRRHGASGLTVLGVSIDEGAPARVRSFVKARKVTYPIAIDADKDPAWAAYRVKAVPAAFLIDREGRIVAQWTGTAIDAKALEARLGEMLAAGEGAAP